MLDGMKRRICHFCIIYHQAAQCKCWFFAQDWPPSWRRGPGLTDDTLNTASRNRIRITEPRRLSPPMRSNYCLFIIHAAGGKVPECFLQTALGCNNRGELDQVEVRAMSVRFLLLELIQSPILLLSPVCQTVVDLSILVRSWK